jgi:AcrR family transcriptional regulator
MAQSMTLQSNLPLREYKKRQKRERLLNASLQLFREKGYEHTKVSDITQAAGVAKGTFFNYFPTKERVLLALGEQMLGRLGQINATDIFQQQTTRGKVKAVFHALAAGLNSDQELVKEMVYRGLRLPDLVDNSRAQLDFRAMLVLLIEQGKRKGEIIETTDVAFVADALYTLYFQQIVIWCSRDFQTSLPEQLDRTVDLIFDGISQPAPPAP